MASSTAVAQTFLELANKEGKHLTNMQLQKLVFFAHGVHLAAFENTPLVDEDAKAWDFGPVFPSLYEKLRKFGRDIVASPIDNSPNFPEDSSERLAIQSVWDTYKKFSGWQLSQISHNPDTPWDIVWNKNKDRYCVIPNDLIFDYYNSRVNTTTAA